uniref:Uncharacterized protein n=1 Tax=Panagrolaimus davidi TaxID=227884 RepID=A0A914Q5E7_9BILA
MSLSFKADNKHAIIPAAFGAEKLVPCKISYLVKQYRGTAVIASPGATNEIPRLPFSPGPREEYVGIIASSFLKLFFLVKTEPIINIFFIFTSVSYKDE